MELRLVTAEVEFARRIEKHHIVVRIQQNVDVVACYLLRLTCRLLPLSRLQSVLERCSVDSREQLAFLLRLLTLLLLPELLELVSHA